MRDLHMDTKIVELLHQDTQEMDPQFMETAM